jgi:putative FmdB family regulatory protein
MPTYEYRCKACGHELEAVQAFTDDPLTVCPECGGDLRKKFGAVGITFKGSGFYKTDSRSSGGAPTTTKGGDAATSGDTASSPDGGSSTSSGSGGEAPGSSGSGSSGSGAGTSSGSGGDGGTTSKAPAAT